MLGLVGPVVAAHSAKRSSQSHVHSSAAQTQLIALIIIVWPWWKQPQQFQLLVQSQCKPSCSSSRSEMSCRQRRTWSGCCNLCDYNSVPKSGLVKIDLKYLIKIDLKYLIKIDPRFLVKIDLKYLVKIDLKYLVKQNLKYLVKIDLKYLVEQNFKYLVKTDLEKLKTNLPTTRRLSTEGGTMMP